MRATALVLLSVLGLAAPVAANAAPVAAIPAQPQASNIVRVAAGCGWGLHRYHGYCVRNHHRPYGYTGYYRPSPYYGGGYQPWNRPSPGDYVANQLNAQQLGRGSWGY